MSNDYSDIRQGQTSMGLPLRMFLEMFPWTFNDVGQEIIVTEPTTGGLAAAKNAQGETFRVITAHYYEGNPFIVFPESREVMVIVPKKRQSGGQE